MIISHSNLGKSNNNTLSPSPSRLKTSNFMYHQYQKRFVTNIFIPETSRCKFQDNKRIIRGTSQSILDETSQPLFKPIRKRCSTSLMNTSLNQPFRRRKNSGQYRKLKQQTLSPHSILNRSVQDIGAINNRRRITPDFRNNNPILLGATNPEKECQNQSKKIWREPRKNRDHGQRTQKLMNWNTGRKQSTYSQMYKKKTGKT